MNADKIKTIEEFIAALSLKNQKIEYYTQLLRRISIPIESFSSFMFFRDNSYTRNLFFASEELEVMLLCWEPGQKTPIHNHNHSDGWLLGLSGHLEETRYLARCEDETSCTLEKKQTAQVHPSAVTYINDQMGVHSIENSNNERAVSLHLYKPIIKTCHAYEFENGVKTLRNMCYYSMDGAVCSP